MKSTLFIISLLLSCALQSVAQSADTLVKRDLMSHGVSFTHDNTVVLLPSGQEKFDDMFRAIRQAKKSIHLEYFNFRNDSIASLLFSL